MDDSSLRLPDHYAIAVKLIEELNSLAGNDPEYKTKQKEASQHLGIANRMVHNLKVFGDSEHFSEHSTTSLAYILIPAHQAELDSKSYPKVDDPERDEKRVLLLESAIGFYREYLTSCVTLGLEKEPSITQYMLDSETQDPRTSTQSREEKVAQMRTLMTQEKKLKELTQRIKDAKATAAPIDEDLEREHMLTTLQAWVAKSKTQIGLLQSEQKMLKQMQEHRRTHVKTPQHTVDPADAPPQKKPEPPIVITKEMVKEMSSNNTSMHRKDFQLITRGFGPLGAPTMTLDQFADIEMANAARASANKVAEVEFDEDNDDHLDDLTYKARDRDVVNDYIRRGDGNRYNMG